MLFRFLRWFLREKKTPRKKEIGRSPAPRNSKPSTHLQNDLLQRTYRKIYTHTVKRNAKLTILIAFVMSMFLFQSLRVFAIILILLIVAALSKLVQEPIPFVVGLDLCLFVMVTIGYITNAFIGFLAGATASFFGSLLRSHQEADTIFVPIMGYFWTALIFAILLKHLNYFQAGAIATLIYAFHNAMVFGKMRHFSIHTITFLSTAIPFNLLLFSKLGPAVLVLLG